jgi:hypothetical protein
LPDVSVTMLSEHINNLLSAYHHGELAPGEAQRVAAHLPQCAECRAEYELIQAGAGLARQLTRTTAPADLWASVAVQLPPPSGKGAWLSGFGWFATLPGPSLALVGTAAALLLTLGSFWFYNYWNPSWEVETLAGSPRIGAQAVSQAARLRVGEWLRTDETAKARLNVGAIGQVELEPNSELQLVTARTTEHRVALQRGKLTAIITAPPRFFFVNTPSATAIDLGCAYTLEVDESGQGTLRVLAGWVAYEERGLESFVPEEAMCITRPVLGPGTPVFEDASPTLQAALARFDMAAADDAARLAALTEILQEARVRDGLTLWHLLARTQVAERTLVFARMAALIPPPPEVTLGGIQRGDRALLDAWWEKLELGSPSWWRLWKAPLPSTK